MRPTSKYNGLLSPHVLFGRESYVISDWKILTATNYATGLQDVRDLQEPEMRTCTLQAISLQCLFSL